MIMEASELEKFISELSILWKKVAGHDISIAERNGLFSSISKLIKQLIHLYGGTDIDLEKVDPKVSQKLFTFLLSMLSFQAMSLDLRISCGLLSVKIYLTSKENNSQNIVHEVLEKQGAYRNIDEIGQLATCHGILCCYNAMQLFEYLPNENEDMASCILQRMCKLLTISNDGNIIILSSRILNHILLRMNDYIVRKNDSKAISKIFYEKYSIQSSLCKEVLDIIWLLWDHFLDSAKHLARESFILFVKFQKTLDYDLALSYFTNIGLILLQEIPKKKFAFNAISFLVPLIGAQTLLTSDKDLIINLVKLLSDSSYATHSANLLESLFVKHRNEVEKDIWLNLWFFSYCKNFSKDMLSYGFESHLGKLLISSDTILFSLDYFTSKKTLSVDEFCLLIMILKLGINLRLSKSPLDLDRNESDRSIFIWKDIIHFKYIINALKCFDSIVRTLSFNLLNDSFKSTELYHQQELDAILNYVEINITNQNPAFRQKFLNCIKKMLNRINKGISAKTKQSKNKKQESTVDENLFLIHEDFISKLFINIIDNLYCGSNFPRRYTSLLILELITDTVMNPNTDPCGSFCYLSPKLYDSSLRNSLLICHGDSYENIKKISLKLLKFIGQLSEECSDFSAFGTHLLKSAWKMSSSPRPLDSLTSSYIINSVVISKNANALFEMCMPYSSSTSMDLNLSVCHYILELLRKETNVAEKSLLKAASTAPMYGQILVLRNLFASYDRSICYKEETMARLLIDIISTCLHISTLVADIVKNASPEGQLPIDFSFENGDLILALNNSIVAQEIGVKNMEYESLSLDAFAKARAVSAQMLLLCGWRSIKEISLLFGFIVQNFALPLNSSNFVTHKNIEDIGNFFLNQLLETKHRGAFEQAYSGFLMVCETLWQSVDLKLNGFPDVWLKHVLDTIADCTDNRLCATRRSAGVPFIVQAILSTEPSIRGGLSLKSTVDILLKLASNDNNIEPKLHAMNILRALYKETHLGDMIMPYVSSGVQIAVNGYNNGAWNVRNSSTLLFSSLVTRMLGVKRSQDDLHSKNSISALIFFKRYPSLYEFFLINMEISISQMKQGKLAPSTYQVLLLLARLAPLSSEGHSTSIPLAPFIPLVLNFRSSPVYQLRTLAAKALIPLLTPSDLISIVNILCHSASFRNQNQIHGNLLFLIQIFKTYKDVLFQSSTHKDVIKDNLQSIIHIATESNTCLFTRAIAMELLAESEIINILLPNNLQELTSSCYSWITCTDQSSMHIGAKLSLENAIKLYININHQNINDILFKLISNTCGDVQTMIFDHLLRLDNFPTMLIDYAITYLKKHNIDMKLCRAHCAFLSDHLQMITKDNELSLDEIFEILLIILGKWDHEYREDHLTCLIELSSKIINFIWKSEREDRCKIILQWTEDVTLYSSVENSSAVRTSSAEALSSVLGKWPSNAPDIDKAELLILKAVLELFTDDDENIREMISKGTLLYLLNQNMAFEISLNSIDNSKNISLHETLSYLFLYLAKGKTDFLSLLIEHSLREEQIEEFGLAQEDDRAFEKGETKVYREDIQIAKDTAKAISVAISLENMNNLYFNINMISTYLLLPIPESIASPDKCVKNIKINFESCDILTFLTILKMEIEYILEKFSVLKQKDIFSFQHFDVWISRLGCRSLIWMAFKEFAKKSSLSIDAIYLENINSALMKPRILANIMEWLSHSI